MATNELLINELDLVRSICRDSLFDTVKEMWPVLADEEFVYNWHIEYLCDEVQQVLMRAINGEPKEYDLIVNIPPGTTKSTICTVVAPVWVWGKKPSFRSICASHTASLAVDLGRKSRELSRSEEFQRLFPMKLKDDQDAKGYFINEYGGSRVAVGSGGSIIGKHAHAIFVDDPIDPQSALSEADLATVNTWMNETLPTRKISKENTPTILIMQRLAQNDPSGEMLAKMEKGRKIKHICLPAELDDAFTVKPEYLSAMYVDGLLDPQRMSREVLAEIMLDLGDAVYSGQFGQSPVARSGGTFKVDRLKVDEINLLEMETVCRYWDKAGTGGGGAYTVGALIGKDRHGRTWILDIVRGQWEAGPREDMIKKVADLDHQIDWNEFHTAVEQEPGSGGKESAQNTVALLAGYTVKTDSVGQSQGNKTRRAGPLASQVNVGNCYLYAGSVQLAGLIHTGPWIKDLIQEFRFFPGSRFKDQVDACSGGYNQIHKPTKRARVE